MSTTLTLMSKAMAFRDQVTTAQPVMKNFDWSRNYTVSVTKPKSSGEELAPGQEHTFFSGAVSTSLDGTTALTVTRSPLEATRYRFTRVSGTSPAFRSDVGLTLATHTLTVAVQSDATALMTLNAGTWGALAEGYEVFIPGVTTGDTAGQFSALNEGWWSVMAVLSATQIQVQRRSGAIFQATSESILIAANTEVQAFDVAGVVMPGFGLDISDGFALATKKTFVVAEVTATWVEIVSTMALPLEVAKTPGATGFQFYTGAKRFIRIESDQEVSVRINGATDDRLRISLFDPADTGEPGHWEASAPVWALTIVNRSSQSANVNVFSCE